eukprot:COSAG01_NODE_34027_length_554_cov_15.312088_1_plen_130_part_10
MPPSKRQTFWAIGKNHAARHTNNKRTMKETMTQLLAGWYGDEKYWAWVAAGKPTKAGPGGASGRQLSAAQRVAATQKRRKKQPKSKAGLDIRYEPVTASDWVPGDCHAPANCAGLIRKVKGEADKMIAQI